MESTLKKDYIFYGTQSGALSGIEVKSITPVEFPNDTPTTMDEEFNNNIPARLDLNFKRHNFNYSIIEDNNLDDFAKFEKEYNDSKGGKLCMCSFNFLKPKKKIKTIPKV